jgi:hypothetical protein
MWRRTSRSAALASVVLVGAEWFTRGPPVAQEGEDAPAPVDNRRGRWSRYCACSTASDKRLASSPAAPLAKAFTAAGGTTTPWCTIVPSSPTVVVVASAPGVEWYCSDATTFAINAAGTKCSWKVTEGTVELLLWKTT